MSAVKFIKDPGPQTLGHHIGEFLELLAGPACLFLTGKDQSRCRAFVTLLHGNEPSGAMALLRYLQSGQQPAANTLCIVASVPAALETPVFSHRMLPRARDLNRCFRPPFDDSQGKLAQQILALIKQHRPEAVIDMHNTSGSGPAYGIATHLDSRHDALTSLFSSRLMITNLRLGALMEISDHLCPTVTIEVGGRMDEAAHLLAYEGLCRFFNQEQVLVGEETDWGIELFFDPVRLELLEHTTLTYGDTPSEHYDVTLKTDIEHHNFGTVSPGTLLGWVNRPPAKLFQVVDRRGKCAVSRLLRTDDGKLYPAAPMRLFMITNSPEIATTDCLFYAAMDQG